MKPSTQKRLLVLSAAYAAVGAFAIYTAAAKPSRAEVTLLSATPRGAISRLDVDRVCVWESGTRVTVEYAFRDPVSGEGSGGSQSFNVSDMPVAAQTQVATFRYRITQALAGHVAIPGVTAVAAGTANP